MPDEVRSTAGTTGVLHAGTWPNEQQLRTINILHVYRTYFPDTQGGLEETVRQICRNTKGLGFCHRIFTLSVQVPPLIISTPEAEVYRYPRTIEIASCGMSLTGILGFRKLAQWADIIHYHFPWPYADLLHFSTGRDNPCLVSYQSDIVRQKKILKLYAPLQKRFLRSVDRIVATSPNYLHSSAVLSDYGDKVSIIPNGIDEAGYPHPTSEALSMVKQKYGEDFFLFVGVLRYYKGLQYLLRAVSKQQFKVVIAGSGPMENELRRQAGHLGLKNVHFAGYVDDLVKNCLLSLTRAVVFPSHERSEAFGMTLLEGAMFGKPLISTEIGTGTSYINQHGITGLVVPPAEPDSLRKAMVKLAGNDQLCDRFGREARKRYEHLFTGCLMGTRYAMLYRELLCNRRRRQGGNHADH